jgi:hypothetical protein
MATKNFDIVPVNTLNPPSPANPVATLLSTTTGAIVYNPGNIADWSGVSPGNIQFALDRLAAFIAANIGPVT